MISRSVKNSSTQLATNWSMRVTQYIPACWHTHTHTCLESEELSSEEDWGADKLDVPWRRMAGPGGRGRGRLLQSPTSVCLTGTLGRHQSGRWWAPLPGTWIIKTHFCEPATAEVWREIKSSPMPVNWESSPTVRSIKKNKMDQRGEMGSLERASGYAMNAKPNPAKQQVHGIRRPSPQAIWAFYIRLGGDLRGVSDLPSPLRPQAFGRYRPCDPVWKIWQSRLWRWYLWHVKNITLIDRKKRRKWCFTSVLLLPALVSVTTKVSLNMLLWKLL